MSPWVLVLALAGEPSSATATAPVERPAPAATETLTLAEASRLLVDNNPDLAAAQASIDEAEAVALKSMAAVKPLLSAGGEYKRNNAEVSIDMGAAFEGLSAGIAQATGQPLMLPPVGEMLIQPLQSVSASAQLDVPLFAANAYWDIKAARTAVQASEASREARALQLRGVLEQTAWLSGAAAAFIDVAEKAVSNAQAHLEMTERLFDAGQTTRLSVDQARVRVVRRRNDLVRAQGELAGAEVAMGALLGREHAVRVVLPETSPPPVVGDLDDAIEHAAAARPELAANQAATEAARARVTAARMRYAPTLNGSFGFQASTAPFATQENYAWQAGLSLRWAIYAGGSRRGEKKRADAALARTQAEGRALRVRVAREVADGRRNLTLARQQLALATEEALLADEAAKTAERLFEHGQSRSLDVLDALDASFQADLRREEAKARMLAAGAQLRAAEGSL